ncbi:hypothetical protein Tco_1302303 [Tanacetum coccineum]
MKNIPTTKEKEEMRRPTVEKFLRLLDSLINYNEVHTTMLFYPKKRRNIRPKAERIDEVQLKSQIAKLNAVSRMKNIPTTKEKEEIRRPIVEKFQRLLDSLINYNEVHTTMLFYPKKRRNIRPKAVFFPEASPKDVYDYFVYGLVDTVYINGETLKELQEFPIKVQSMIKGYKEIFTRGRELFLKMHSSYPIFDKEQKLLVPSITVAQLGVSNKGYQDKDVKIECTPPTIDNLVYSFMEVLAGSSKIGTEKLNADSRMKNIPTIKEKEEMRRPIVEKFQRLLNSLINYNEVHTTMLFYPKKRRNIRPKAVFFPEASPKDVYDYFVYGLVDTERIDEVQLKELSDFKDQIELFLGLSASLPEDLKQRINKVSSIVFLDAGISLVPTHAADQGRIDDTQISDQPKEQLGVFSVATTLADAARRRQKQAKFEAEQEQEKSDFETAHELQKQLDEREEVVAQAHDIDWSDPADIDWSDPVVLRYHTLQNRPFSVAKDEASSFAQKKPARGSRKKSLARKRARETLSEESAKKHKLEDDTKKEELQVYLNIVLEEESLNIESLATNVGI